jgi:hypothetical protein
VDAGHGRGKGDGHPFEPLVLGSVFIIMKRTDKDGCSRFILDAEAWPLECRSVY